MTNLQTLESEAADKSSDSGEADRASGQNQKMRGMGGEKKRYVRLSYT